MSRSRNCYWKQWQEMEGKTVACRVIEQRAANGYRNVPRYWFTCKFSGVRGIVSAVTLQNGTQCATCGSRSRVEAVTPGMKINGKTVVRGPNLKLPREKQSALMRCGCGFEQEHLLRDLRRGRTSICPSCTGKKRRRDWSGVRRGLRVFGKDTGKRSGTRVIWTWRCDCGNEGEGVPVEMTLRGCMKCYQKRRSLAAEAV